MIFNTKNLKRLRKTKGYSQEEIADLLHISQSTYARLESGKSITWCTYLKKLSEIFQVNPIVFLNLSPNANLQKIQFLEETLKEKDEIIVVLENRIINLESSLKIFKNLSK